LDKNNNECYDKNYYFIEQSGLDILSFLHPRRAKSQTFYKGNRSDTPWNCYVSSH